MTAQSLIIAMVIAAEACGEGTTGMIAVANTLQHRSKTLKTSLYSVATAPKQYSGLTAPNRHKLYEQCKDEANAITDKLLRGRLDDITGGALYFKRPEERRRAWHKKETFRYKNHIFYK